ncbi:MAG TPA: hypothetical protein VGF14_04455 [Alphaproteobacteria bacterium]
MPKFDLPTSLEKLTTTVMDRLPPDLKKHLEKLSPQQKQSLILAGCGAGGFLVLWLVFALLFSGGDSTLDQRAFGPQGQQVKPGPVSSVSTAITKPIQAFPQEKDPIISRKKQEEPIIKTADNLTAAQKEQIARLRENVEHQYKSTLPFALNETKMISFALAASRIDKVNMRWDTLIAGTADEKLALEYLSSAELENKQLLHNTPGLNLEQYDMIYNLSARDNKFNEIANAYKNLVAQGIWGPVTPLTDSMSWRDGRKNDNSDLRFPIAPPKSEEVPATPIPAQPQTTPQPQSAITPAVQPVPASMMVQPVTATPADVTNPVAAPAANDTAPAPAH